MTDKEYKEMEEMAEQAVETFEYTDEDGVEHCFIVESKFPVGQDMFAALLEVDPSVFEEEAGDCCCGRHHDHEKEPLPAEAGCDGNPVTEDEAENEEDINIILAKIIEDENGEIDIRVPTDAEFEKARLAYEALADE